MLRLAKDDLEGCEDSAACGTLWRRHVLPGPPESWQKACAGWGLIACNAISPVS
jgi:hypothetical protein